MYSCLVLFCFSGAVDAELSVLFEAGTQHIGHRRQYNHTYS